ncbi:Histone-lysine N-methyltransferase SETMAR, partial [Harpegnathos saltator]
LHRVVTNKRPEYAKRFDKVIFKHDNARPHVGKIVKATLEVLGWDLVLPQPPYSPDIAPSDCHLFRSMAHELSDQHFNNYEEIEKWLSERIASKDESFSRHRMQQLPD